MAHGGPRKDTLLHQSGQHVLQGARDMKQTWEIESHLGAENSRRLIVISITIILTSTMKFSGIAELTTLLGEACG